MSVQVAQIEAQIKTVRTAYADALKSVTGTIWSSDEEKNAQRALMSLRNAIDGWAQRGLSAAKASPQGVPNGVNGWAGWRVAGQEFQRGFPDIARERVGEYTLADIVETTAKAAKTVARKTAGAAVAVAETAGKASAAALKPFLIPLAIGAGVFLFLKFRA